ncbi:unnamed protein product [Strongylus vulgaris]|uniref:Uncharacterized protein n=1 Tax=Strongylus vulgaris TaxID=40348 RepID=A0A3P7JJI6_STRVU|nr:unnamed protein product [Strongylus vulgaris]
MRMCGQKSHFSLKEGFPLLLVGMALIQTGPWRNQGNAARLRWGTTEADRRSIQETLKLRQCLFPSQRTLPNVVKQNRQYSADGLGGLALCSVFLDLSPPFANCLDL